MTKEEIYAETRKPLDAMAAVIELPLVIDAVAPDRVCPFCGRHALHVGKSPRMPGGYSWHCFGCDSGGTVIKFIERMIEKVGAESDRRLANL